jgi:thiol-disulfide isomerase/thioredoxin
MLTHFKREGWKPKDFSICEREYFTRNLHSIPILPIFNINFYPTPLINTVHPVSCKEQRLSILEQNKNSCFIFDFYSDACPPCKAIALKYADLAQQYPNLCFFKVNLTEFLQSQQCQSNHDGMTEYAKGISLILCFKFYSSVEATEPVWEFMG